MPFFAHKKSSLHSQPTAHFPRAQHGQGNLQLLGSPTLTTQPKVGWWTKTGSIKCHQLSTIIPAIKLWSLRVVRSKTVVISKCSMLLACLCSTVSTNIYLNKLLQFLLAFIFIPCWCAVQCGALNQLYKRSLGSGGGLVPV